MPTNYTGRVILIVLVLLGAIFCIVPQPQKLFQKDVPFSKATNLKPGIDMVGGTSLLYEIKIPEGTTASGDLATKVMEALKKRVDPSGVKNLIWRPQGNSRLEIQMPMTTDTANASAVRAAYAEAQQKLEGTNIRQDDVLKAVQELKGEARDSELKRLAMGSDSRATLFGKLRSTWDQKDILQKKFVEAQAQLDAAAEKQNNAAAIAQKKKDKEAAGFAVAQNENDYEDLKKQIESSNLSSQALQEVLDAPAAKRGSKLEEMKQAAADFPVRKEAIEKYQTAYAEYNKIKNTIDAAADLKRLLKGSGVLEYHILVTDSSLPMAQQMLQRLDENGVGPRPQANDTMRWYEADRPDEFMRRGGNVVKEYLGKVYVLAWTVPEKSMVHKEGVRDWSLQEAYQTRDKNEMPAVGFRFDTKGGILMAQLTASNVNQPMAIILDNKIISAPNINEQIHDSGIITGGGKGGFSKQEMDYLVKTLSAGSLPAQLADEPISERTIQPELGADNLHKGLTGCLVGLIGVGVFMCGYYYLGGIVAALALLMNMVMILGVLAAMQATFTLPSIAALALTIGTSVDANVLVFERLREELHHGQGLRMAMGNAYNRAWSAIVDSNVTTAITSVFLYWFGTEEVKGFGLTLLIGIICSLFNALFVTKTIFGIWIDKFGLKNLSSFPMSVPAWDRFLKPKINWMGLAWIFYTFSAVFIVIGSFLFVQKYRQHDLFDIEFVGGTSVQFELKEPVALSDMRGQVQKADPKANPVPVGKEYPGQKYDTYKVTTPEMNRKIVQDSIMKVFEGRLKLEVPSKFEMVGSTAEAAVNKVIVPIKDRTVTVDGWTPPSARMFDGGVAIVLKGLDPMLTPADIKARIDRQRLQAQADSTMSGYRQFTVESPKGNGLTDQVVVLASDPQIPYAKDPAKWEHELAGPMWKLVNDAVARPPSLQEVTNFNAQVAGEMQVDAALALGLSVLVIMAYIWMRFGNLKYGTATVIAMLHDTLFTVAAIGFAHYIYESVVGRVLMLEPFRINLTVVAGILTVMSYSMIDTIVVFDRIREIRGKFGYLSRTIVNDAINQTLSRTLLTAGTTVATVAIMYFVGGPSIHGFTFVLLIGILVGTYSSVAIASPILLVGAQREAALTQNAKPSVGQVQRAG